MKEIKLEIIECYENDVIATSGLCSMQGESYFLSISRDFDRTVFCGWDLCGDDTSIVKGLEDNSRYFSYINENGTQISTDLYTNNWPEGDTAPIGGDAMWFHYDGTNFYLCNNKDHHHIYTIGG